MSAAPVILKECPVMEFEIDCRECGHAGFAYISNKKDGDKSATLYKCARCGMRFTVRFEWGVKVDE